MLVWAVLCQNKFDSSQIDSSYAKAVYSCINSIQNTNPEFGKTYLHVKVPTNKSKGSLDMEWVDESPAPKAVLELLLLNQRSQ